MEKVDFKNIFIGVLLTLLIFISYNWYFKGDSDYKNQLNLLRDENKILQKTRDSLSLNILNLEFEFENLKRTEDSLLFKIELLDDELIIYKKRVSKTRKELDSLRNNLIETNKKIEDFKKTPPNRTGDALINSIKNKTQL